MSVACFIESDLSVIRLFGEGIDETWRAPSSNASEAETPSATAQTTARALDAAQWTARRLGRAHRLGAVCIGLDEALCARVSAPSPSKEVIAAAMNQRAQEWLSSIGASSVEALSPSHQQSRSGDADADARDHDASPRQFTVLDLRDGPIRLWLDELDRQGVNAEPVLTLWHAMAKAWTDRQASSEAVTAVLLDQPDTCLWAWSQGGELIAAGSALKKPASSSEESPPAIPQRLTLDWLTWGAKLKTTPERIVVVAADTRPIIEDLASLWPDVLAEGRDAEDPLAQTLAALDVEITPDDPCSCLTSLSNRPGRAHRRLAMWTATAIVLLAAGMTSLGWRQHLSTSGAVRVANDLRQSIREQVASIEPALADNADPARALRSVLAQEEETHQPIDAPSTPVPMFDALAQLGEALSATLGEVDSAHVRSIKFDEISVDVQVSIPDFATGEAVLEHLRTGNKHLRWSGSFSGSPPAITQMLRATWVEEDA